MQVDYEKLCFVIMPFGKEGTPEETKWKTRFNDLIKRAVYEAELNLICRRADDFNKPGGIPEDICQKIERSRFVIADLSDENPNVAYELGLRHARRHCTILIAEKDTRLPFDFSKERTIFFTEDEQGKEKAIGKITAYLKEMYSDPDHEDSPYLRTIELVATDGTGGPTKSHGEQASGEVVTTDNREFGARVNAVLFQHGVLPESCIKKYNQYHVYKVMKMGASAPPGSIAAMWPSDAHYYVVSQSFEPYVMNGPFYSNFCQLLQWCGTNNVFENSTKLSFIFPFNGSVPVVSDVISKLIHHSHKYLRTGSPLAALFPIYNKKLSVSDGSLEFAIWDIPRIETLEKEMRLA